MELKGMDMPIKKRTIAAQAAEHGPLPEMPAELLNQLAESGSGFGCCVIA